MMRIMSTSFESSCFHLTDGRHWSWQGNNRGVNFSRHERNDGERRASYRARIDSLRIRGRQGSRSWPSCGTAWSAWRDKALDKLVSLLLRGVRARAKR